MELLLAVAILGAIAALLGGAGLLIGRWLAPQIDRWTAGGEENAQREDLDDDER